MAVIKPSAKTTPVKANTKSTPAKAATPVKAPVAKVDSITVTLPFDHATPNCVVLGVDWKKNPNAPARTFYISGASAESLSVGEGDEVEVTFRKVTR